MTPSTSDHWNEVYGRRAETALTWFEAVAGPSLDLIRERADPGDAILDVGGGASRLVDGLLDAGLGPVTVLDLSATALATSRARLGPRADAVSWVCADVTEGAPTGPFAIWHDRAAFHFLTRSADRERYVDALAGALAPGGTAIIATFAEDGPETCSNLPVMRYSPDALLEEFQRIRPGLLSRDRAMRHLHVTPRGAEQPFQVSVLRRSQDA